MHRGTASRARERRALTPTLSQSTGRGGNGKRILKSQRLPHDVQRALFHLFVDPADVLPQNPDRDELHAAEEQDAEDDCREPGPRLFMEGEEGDEVVEGQYERDAGDDEARVGDGAQRAVAEA